MKTNQVLEKVGKCVLGFVLVWTGKDILDSSSAGQISNQEAWTSVLGHVGLLGAISVNLLTKV